MECNDILNIHQKMILKTQTAFERFMIQDNGVVRGLKDGSWLFLFRLSDSCTKPSGRLKFSISEIKI